MSLPPFTPAQILKNAATAEIALTINRGLVAMDAGDNLGAAQAFAQATAVSAVYATVTAYGLAVSFPIAGLAHALSALSKSPSLMGNLLLKSGLVSDPLVVLRLENVAKAFSAGAAAAWMTSKAIDWINDQHLGSGLYDLKEIINLLFRKAWDMLPARDPLVLDLDGDGIEANGIDPVHPLRFDHDADGIKTATGWIKSDDGIVVLDRNGNGTIDSGRELFGDNTLLENGPRAGELAAHGYEALADLDLNGDQKIDALDAAFARLRIWQDLNQDGVSQANELKSLAELGIASIAVTAAATNIDLGNGNTQPWTASFTRTNGTTGESGTPELSGSLLLASNNFFRTFTDDPELTDAAVSLPQMLGSGLVRDLSAAMSMGTASSLALQNELTQFVGLARDGQRAALDSLILRWAETSSLPDAKARFGAPNPVTVLETSAADAVHNFATANPDLYNKITALERFNGDAIFEQMDVVWTRGNPVIGMGVIRYHVVDASTARVGLLNSAWEALQESVYANLALQTRLKPYLDGATLVTSTTGLQLDPTGIIELLESRKAVDLREALFDLVDLNLYAQPSLLASGFDGTEKLRIWIDALPANSPLRAELLSNHVYLDTASTGSTLNDVYLGTAAANQFRAGVGDDAVDGGGGNDFLHGDAGNDALKGAAGDDRLFGGDGDDALAGGEGNDGLSGEDGDDTLAGGAGDDNLFGGDGNDVLIGDSGSDQLLGGNGDDTYHFGLNFGQHVVVETGNALSHDTIDLAELAPSDVRLYRDAEDLVISVNGTTDRIKVQNYFSSDGAGGNAVEFIELADGRKWSIEQVKALVLLGDESAQVLTGYAVNDTIHAMGGNDTVNGRAGDDSIFGGSGNDSLLGEDGADTLDGEAGDDILQGDVGDDVLRGGLGNDTLYGGTGRDHLDGGGGDDALYGGSGYDTYQFGRNSGNDTVIDSNSAENKLVFDVEVRPGEVVVVRRAGDLILAIASRDANPPAATLTVRNYFVDGLTGDFHYALDAIEFSDGTVWTASMIRQRVLLEPEYGEFLTGYSSSDSIHGGGESDQITGGRGSDTLFGGEGDDVLLGDDGYDALNFQWGGAVIESPLYGTPAYTGWAPGHNDILDGGDGNDVLFGETGNDVLLGGDGSDKLYGGAGNDLLDGGAQVDAMDGGKASDTYMFGRGDGQDAITDRDATQGNKDCIVFKTGVRPEDVQISRNYNTLVLTIAGTTDTIEVSNYFYEGLTDWRVEEIRFTDSLATVWTFDVLSEKLLSPGIALNGTPRNDTLTGTPGPDTLNGLGGADKMSGGEGDDTYIIDTLGDTVIELTGQGIDTVRSSIAHTLAANVENLLLTGAASINGVGNDLSNILTGNSGNNTLNGGAGADAMAAGAGNDNYIVDDAGDTAVELADEGFDTVKSSVSYTLSVYIEELTLLGTATLNATGNAQDNTLRGTIANNILDGRGGADKMIGGAGDDTYVVDSIGDAVVESAGNGIDTVMANVSYFLAPNVDNLTLTGTASINATGNGQTNILTGNSGHNILIGGGGADTMSGGGGNDTLVINTNISRNIAKLGLMRLDGGAGRDTLALDDTVAGVTVTLTGLDDAVVTGIECIDVTGGGNNVLVMNVRDMMSMHDAGQRLAVTGNDGDKLQLVKDTGNFNGAWTWAGTQVLEGVTYNAWQNTSAADEVLLVGQALIVSLV